MVSFSFKPQIQAALFNYVDAARELDLVKARLDDLKDCACRASFVELKPAEDMNSLGHVCTFNTQKLKWPYLRSLTEKGKKFRLPTTTVQLFRELDAGLDTYVEWATTRGVGSFDVTRDSRLEQWAVAVKEKASANWVKAERLRGRHDIEGYPGLRQAIVDAKRDLVFLHDDRAPHGLFLVCKRWYQQQMAAYLLDNTVFESVSGSWTEIMEPIGRQLTQWGFPVGSGIVYNYGIWKPRKLKFRYIAGTRANIVDETQREQQQSTLGPPRAPTFFLAKMVVKCLNVVIKSLKKLDMEQQQHSGLRCFWGIDSINDFTQMVRTNTNTIVTSGMRTFDFTTMYTSLPFENILNNVMASISEAQQFEASKSVQKEGDPLLSETGWSLTHGWSLPKWLTSFALCWLQHLLVMEVVFDVRLKVFRWDFHLHRS